VRAGAAAWIAAASVALFGIGVVLLRPALPVDETRYLEVLRESLGANPLLLRLEGQPYADKPPLVFWLARAAGAVGIAPEVAMRCLPALATALGVLLVGRIAKRAGLTLGAWFQASLLLPLVYSQYLLVDPLLACAVAWALDAWTRGRDREAALASAAAFLAKGPVALLFLAPFFWSFAPLRDPRARLGRRGAAVLAAGLVPLAAWAVLAAVIGGDAFASELLWNRWGGRVVESFAHRHGYGFYVPVLLAGALPCTPLLPRLVRARGAEPWVRRTVVAVVAILVAFSLISGKQPHYLLPLAPALALLCAWGVERSRSGVRALRWGAGGQTVLLLAAIATVAIGIERASRFGPGAREMLERREWMLPLGLAAAALAGAAVVLARRPKCARSMLGAATLGAMLALLPVHWLAGRVFHPRRLASALKSSPGRAVAYVGSSSHGVYRWLASSDDVVKVEDRARAAIWCSGHPGGLVIVDREHLECVAGLELEDVAEDVVHGKSVVVLQAPASPAAVEAAFPTGSGQ
jgi:4-amino-4-deoxy-L-arabinose transferase-like glycosyltransferase